MQRKTTTTRNKPRAPGLAAILLATSSVAGHAADAGPKVPAGRDPGGYPVAVVGQGLDYTRDAIAPRLARDGEGEIIGYDFRDDDRRPFAAAGDTAAAEIVLSEGQASTLVAVRVDLADLVAAGKAIRYAAEAPGKIVLVRELITDTGRLALFEAATKRFPNKLFIAPVAGTAPARAPSAAADALLLVTDSGRPTVSADVAAPPLDATSADAAAIDAAARIAALAARLVAVDTELSPAALKARILGLAEPQQAEPRQPPVITNPRRHYWLE